MASEITSTTQASPEGSSGKVARSMPCHLDLTVICPFYNEAGIIEEAVRTLLARLQEMDLAWELIVVNDGSTDGSGEIVERLATVEPRLRVISYQRNRGRGFALRQGIEQARGDVVVTTEIDLSWGVDVVDRLYAAMTEHPEADMVVASPHLPGGGYKNVPAKRVFLSKFGNHVIRACMSNAVSMNTGMTRAYRREMIQTLPLEEDRKEFHIDVIIKAQALKYTIHEIPCILEWKAYKHKGSVVERKSSSKVNKLVVTHTLFSLFANPIRYIWGMSLLMFLMSFGFLVWAFVRLILGDVSVFVALISLLLSVIGLMFFTFGVITRQGFMVQREIWSLRRTMRHDRLFENPNAGDGSLSDGGS